MTSLVAFFDSNRSWTAVS